MHKSGTRLTTHDSVTLHWLFRRAAVGIMLIIGVGVLGGSPSPAIGARAVVEIMTFFAVGLITILASMNQGVDATNFVYDIDLTGIVSQGDVDAVKANAGTAL